VTVDESLKSLARTQTVFATAGLVCAAAGQALAPRALSPLTYTLSGAFLAFVLYAGRELSRGTHRGILLSLIAQAAQVVHLNFATLGLLFLAGPFVELGASSSVVLVTAGAGAVGYVASSVPITLLPGARLAVHFGFRLDTTTPHPAIAMGINVVALVFAARLWKVCQTLTPIPAGAPSMGGPAA
jgi:hypothetical protein